METKSGSQIGGLIAVLSAYIIWGFSVVYFKAVAEVPPLEILCHRVIWSVLLLFVLLVAGRRVAEIRVLLARKRLCAMLLLTSILIGMNWFVFIWAVTNGYMLDASLGYFINPLVSVLLGMIFLRERLTIFQWLAVVFACVGVAIQLIRFGSLPVVALFLACSFAFYGLFRKQIGLEPRLALFVETALLFPVAFGYLVFFAQSPTANIWNNSFTLNMLLLFAGVITTVPLLCFTYAASRLRLSTLGFCQYLSPSIMFLLALFCYREPLHQETALTFGFIWIALLIFTADGLVQRRGKMLK